MNQDRWREIKTQIKQNFELLEEYNEDLDPGTAQILEFIGPSGRTKIRFVSRPKVLDKKTTYSNRAGSGVKVDYVYSPDELVNYFEAFVWSDDTGDWQKLETPSLF